MNTQNNHHLSREEISLYAEQLAAGAIANSEQHIAQHIKECDECAQAVLAVTEILMADLEQDSPVIRPKVIRFPVRTMLGIAASVAAVIVLFFYVDFSSNIQQEQLADHQSDIEEFQQDTQTILLITEDTSYSVSSNHSLGEQGIYPVNERLEQLVDRFSGVAFRGDDVKIISDSELMATVGEQIILEWSNTDHQLLIIEILDHNEKKIKELETVNDKVMVVLSQNGVYYWKLINQEYDLLFCGRIHVKE
ncbi:MAG: hypothetical protein JEZ03_07415 [Bacteroidales bacterium]|nr:hypothetical protein [Bacteroidales bacterium]